MSDTYRSREERKQAERKKQEGQTSEKPKKSGKPKKKGSFLKKFLIACLLTGIVVLGAGVSTFFAMVKDAPKIDESKLADPLSTKFYDRNNTFLHEYGSQKRTKITYDQIPKVLENAFLATEDSRFYEHHGIDIKRTAKAILENITGGFGSQGGSTITQQVIKNYFLSPKKTLERKVQEWYLAYKLEQKYSKHEILEMYMNKIFLGNQAYGVAAAAKAYYGIDNLKDLTLPQAAMLAGLPQGPSIYDPSNPENVEDAKNRRDIVLSAMYKQNFITKQQMDDAMNVPVTEGVLPRQNNPMPYQAFLDAAVKEVESQLKDVDISTDGLQIYTTLDPEQQSYADKLLDTEDIIDYPNDRFQAAFVFMDTRTGEVRAIGSGRKEHKATFRGSNFAIDMNRQPGSTFKPIFDYGPAIENLKWATSHIVKDAPTTYSNGTPIKNWNNDYKGDISIRTALQWSYNIPALNTLKEVGLEKARTFSEGLGITFDKDVVYESYAIGSNAVNPLEMAGAYGAFANDGMYTKPHFIRKIVFPDGKELSFEPEPQRAMSDYTAYMVTDMLRTVVDSGTGTAANVPSLDVAGKTGTTNFEKQIIAKFGYPSSATSDSWFVGYTPQYTMSVWTGYAQNGSGNYMVGNTQNIAKYIFKQMMQNFGNDNSAFAQPSSVVRQDDNELYVKGEMRDYVPVKVDTPSGLQAKYNQAKREITLSWSYTQSKLQNTTFNVNYSLDGGQSTPLKTNTKDVTLTLGNAKAGGRYTFSVTAASRGKTGSAATITVVVPAAATEKKSEETNTSNNNASNTENNSTNNGNNTTNNNGNSTNNETAEPNNNNNTDNSNTNGENTTPPSTQNPPVSEEDVGIPNVP